jgi:putative DNA primase/helicase
MALLSAEVEPPCWLKGDAPFKPAELIPCKNALVHLPSVVVGDLAEPRKMTVKPTPRLFCTYALEFDFDLDVEPPEEWLGFLDWPSDPQSISTLQEWFGYCLTPDTSQEKILALIGPKRAGKDTIARILADLVGRKNAAGPTLAGLSTQFGLESLIGKPLAVVSDARISGRTDSSIIVERLLAISGRGRLTVDRKFLHAWDGNLPTRFVLISNELPRLTDAAGALASRLVILRLTKSFYGEEDLELYDRLKAEQPGILLWAIEGWRRLQERGCFVQPESGADLKESLEEFMAPVLTFIHQWCAVGPALEVETGRLFGEWKRWCEENGHQYTGTQQSFGKDLRAACPSIRSYNTTRSGKQLRFFQGINIKD